MSAMTGICDFRAMAGRACASSGLGQATRTMSQPAAVSSAICWSVALMSVVGVVVIDCTDTGASPPTSTLPTVIFRLTLRGETTGGGSGGIPRETDMGTSLRRCGGCSAAEVDGFDDVGVDEQQRGAEQHHRHRVGDGERLGDVDVAGVGPPEQLRDLALEPLPERTRDVAAV